MVNEQTLQKLRERYHDVHPLLFHRSVERAKNDVELFDILDTIPDFPLTWDEQVRRWMTTTDVFQSKEFQSK